MKISTPHLLTFNGGYVDTAGYLALQGLFTAHVTGNFVTLGASLVHGTSGAIAKLLALPTFCLIVVLARYASARAAAAPAARDTMLAVKILLFAIAATLALRLGPFEDGDRLPAIATGLILVAAMAIQNALHRVYFPKAPPTTLMTGSTTQIMLDLADLAAGGQPPEARAAARARCASLATSVCIFAIGCGVAALIYARAGMAVFVLPPVVALLAFLPFVRAGDKPAAA